MGYYQEIYYQNPSFLIIILIKWLKFLRKTLANPCIMCLNSVVSTKELTITQDNNQQAIPGKENMITSHNDQTIGTRQHVNNKHNAQCEQ